MDDDGDDYGLPDPDWDRYVLPGANPKIKLGSPVRWGASAQANVPAALLETPTEQFLRIQTADAYSRSWSIIGTVQMPSAIWAVTVAPFSLAVLLEVSQGAGQTTIRQNLVLAVGGNPTGGLCNTQHVNNGGPYFSEFSGPGNTIETRPFAAIGALVGNGIAIRARFIGFAPFTGLPATPIVSAIVTPYAAGEGL